MTEQRIPLWRRVVAGAIGHFVLAVTRSDEPTPRIESLRARSRRVVEVAKTGYRAD